MASLILRPGARVRLKGQDSNIPDFYVVRCDRDRCWIRQQNWNPEVQLNIQFNQILIPDDIFQAPPLQPLAAGQGGGAGVTMPILTRSAPPVALPSNIISLADYRRRKAR